MDCGLYLQNFGFESRSATEWSPLHIAKLDASRRMLLEISVDGHREVDGHTWYEISCVLCREDQRASCVKWVAQRRLASLRAELYDPIQELLAPMSYYLHFGATPFARRGGIPGTTARLQAWCRSLAQAASAAQLPPLAVATVLHALGAPEPNVTQQSSQRLPRVSMHITAPEPNPEVKSAQESGAVSPSSIVYTSECFSCALPGGTDVPGVPAVPCELDKPSESQLCTDDTNSIAPEVRPVMAIGVSEDSLFSAECEASALAECLGSEKAPMDGIYSQNPPCKPWESNFSSCESQNSSFCKPWESAFSNCSLTATGSEITTDQLPESSAHEGEDGIASTAFITAEESSADSTIPAMLLPESPSLVSPFGSLPHGSPSILGLCSFWTQGDAGCLRVRGAGYRKTKAKTPSDIALYDTIGADALRSRSKISGVVDKLVPGFSFLGAPTWTPEWGVPRVVVINAQIPYRAGPAFGKHPPDDGGFSLISYHVLSTQAAEHLASNSTTPALRLWRRFVEAGVSTRENTALKAIARVENMESLSVPIMVKKFDGKPVLVTKSASVLQHWSPEVLEIEFDVRQWAFLARQALVGHKNLLKEAVVQLAYLIEGKSDDELPEQVLTQFRIHHADMERAKEIPDK